MRFIYHSFFRKFASLVLSLPRIWKRAIVLSLDILICIATVYFAFYLRLGYWVTSASVEFIYPFIWAAGISLALALPIFVLSGLYLAIFRYSGLPALMTIAKATCIYGIAYALLFSLIGFGGVPRTIGLLQPLLLLLAVGLSRALANIWLAGDYLSILKKSSLPKVLIYGAGSSGRQLAAAMANSHEMKVVGFLDDDSRLQGLVIQGLRIYSPDDLPSLVNTLKVGNIFLALPSLKRSQRNTILEKITYAKVSVRTLPSLVDLAQGKVTVADLRELDIEDLLDRSEVDIEDWPMPLCITDQVIIVTGAGGSIGSELCRQIILLQPRTLVLVEHSEIALYQIHNELMQKAKVFASIKGRSIDILPILGSVTDIQAMKSLIELHRPHTIYHTAAYKHVPMVEANAFEGIKNNTFGTLCLAQIALNLEVPQFVLISTDKAVNPTNVMGASKRLAEMVLQAMATLENKTTFTMVRFGNVLASSGSVIPKFREQIKAGGPVTITDRRMTRYFMTIPEAVQLIIHAGAMAKGGEVFLLDMGNPVRIIDLARRMIELSGLEIKDENNPNGEIEITEIGSRPGEKLYEELLISGHPIVTEHPRIFKAHEECLSWPQMQEAIQRLTTIVNSYDRDELDRFLDEIVPGFQSNGIK